MRRRREAEAGGREIAELAALADGTLAPARRAALEARVAASAELADQLAEQQRALAVAVGLAVFRSGPSGVRFHAALSATELAPGASGEATLSKTASGWRIELDARGLPRLQGGRFYEAWLRNSAGVLVPIGTFNQGHKLTLWAGVPPT